MDHYFKNPECQYEEKRNFQRRLKACFTYPESKDPGALGGLVDRSSHEYGEKYNEKNYLKVIIVVHSSLLSGIVTFPEKQHRWTCGELLVHIN